MKGDRETTSAVPVLVKGARKARDLTQRDVADALGIRYESEIGALEAGRRKSMDTERTLKIMALLEIPPEVMLAAIEGHRDRVDFYLNGLAVEAKAAPQRGRDSRRADSRKEGGR